MCVRGLEGVNNRVGNIVWGHTRTSVACKSKLDLSPGDGGETPRLRIEGSGVIRSEFEKNLLETT